ncbi:MAG: 50S ribosomal protein L24 [Elusimicrobia bacterium]|nr:50S ribosomal protein L24 [Elusimicrobiota bacterium]
MFRIKKKDTVKVKKGKDKGKQGEVVKIYEDRESAIVSKVNLVKRHTRPTQQSPGGLVEKEAPVKMSNLQLICPKCSQPTRVKFDFLEDGEKVRVCKKCGEMIV